MAAWEVITGRALNPGAGPVALTTNTGDSFQIRSTPDSQPPFLEGLWMAAASAGLVRLRSPRMHDFVQGLRFTVPAGVTRNLLADEIETQMYSQDIVTFEIGGGGAETDSAAFLMRYPDLGGSDQRLATWDQIKPMVAELTTVEVAVPGPVTAGDWSAGTAINVTFDLLKGNQDYAILGYSVDTLCTAVAFKGSDTANLRIGGPGPLEPIETRDWFISLARNGGVPAIPVINQANRASTLLHVCKNTAAGTVNVDLVVARLTGKFS
jgi:hypothetical protein